MLTPTVSNSDSTKLILAADALSVAIQVMLWPMAMAVLGIARITCTSIPSWLRISWQLTPDTTEISKCLLWLAAGFISSSNLLIAGAKWLKQQYQLVTASALLAVTL
jgi:hypothetical protein